MIEDPLTYALQFEIRAGDTIIVHVESHVDVSETLKRIAQHGANCGVTLRPGTSLETIRPYLDEISMVLVMSVEPGFGGQAFLPDALHRIRELRDWIGKRPIDISVDGGINEHTIRSVAETGADIAVAGSAIFGAEDPTDAIRRLRHAVSA
jgi:ribulose-phosphate 3-epimerase